MVLCMVNYNPMSKEFQEEAKKRGISGFEYMMLLRGRSHTTSEGYQKYQKSPGSIKQSLIKKYMGKSLENVIGGRVIDTERGTCYHIESREKIDIANIDDAKHLFFDIETMGFSSVPIILIGSARIYNGNILIDQYLSRSVREEPAMLMAFANILRGSDAIVTFNGKRFDVPFIEDRLSYHDIKENVCNKVHHDALYLSRRRWRAKLPNCKLGTLEERILCVKREDDVPSRSIPDFYSTYLRQKNVGPLVPIVDHNKQDLITLARIFSKLREST